MGRRGSLIAFATTALAGASCNSLLGLGEPTVDAGAQAGSEGGRGSGTSGGGGAAGNQTTGSATAGRPGSGTETTVGAGAGGTRDGGGTTGASTGSTGAGASVGTTGTGGPSAGTTGVGGASAGTAGAGAGGSTGGAGGTPCSTPSRLSMFTLAIHVTIDLVVANGSGPTRIHLWSRSNVTANGSVLLGDTSWCGMIVPPFMGFDLPNALWDLPNVPRFTLSGTIEGWQPGSSFTLDATTSLIGLTMASPMAMWPASYTGVVQSDVDSDGRPGVTATPRAGSWYIAPADAVDYNRVATKLYMVWRSLIGLSGNFTSCDELSGAARVTFFDTHVLGCLINTGVECTGEETDSLDQRRQIYTPMSAYFVSKKLGVGASCADARAAVP